MKHLFVRRGTVTFASPTVIVSFMIIRFHLWQLGKFSIFSFRRIYQSDLWGF
jgi:hypothetical protein